MEDAEDMANKEDNVVNGDGASDDDDSDEHQFDLGIILDMIKVPLQKTDEFAKFAAAVKELSSSRPNEIGVMVGQLTAEQKEMLKKLIKTKRVVISTGGEGPQQQPD